MIAGSVVGLCLVALIAQSALAGQMDEWRLLPRVERVTELYFTDYSQLPASISLDAQQTVMFTVRNLEHRTTDYRYELTATSEEDQTEHILGSGRLTLTHDESLDVHSAVTLPVPDKRVAVKVTLEYMGIVSGEGLLSAQMQTIHYWVTIDQSEQKGDINEET